LPPPGGRDNFGQNAHQRLIGKRDLRRQALLVLGERDEVRQSWAVCALEVVPGVIDDGVAELSGPVWPEVEENHTVAVADRGNRVGARRHDPGRLEELVGGPGRVALLDEGNRIRGRRAGRLDRKSTRLNSSHEWISY